MKSYN